MQVCEEQADGVMGRLHLGSRNLSANGVAPSQEVRPWISAMALGSFGELATATSGTAFSQVQPRAGQDGCPIENMPLKTFPGGICVHETWEFCALPVLYPELALFGGPELKSLLWVVNSMAGGEGTKLDPCTRGS